MTSCGRTVLLVVGTLITGLAWTVYAVRLSPLAVVLDLPSLGVLLGSAAVLLSGLGAWKTWAGSSRRYRGALATLALVSLLIVGLWIVDRSVSHAVEEVRFHNGEIRLAGTLYLPRSPGPHPAIVMIHGSGPESRHEYEFYARFFAQRGVAGLAYDKRGVGQSTGSLYGTDYSGYAEDALAAVRFLRQHPQIDPDHVGLMGVSEGEWVAPLVAAGSEEVDFVVVTSASGLSPSEQVNAEIAERLRARRYADSIVQQAVALNRHVLEYQRTGVGGDSLQSKLNTAQQFAWFRDADNLPEQVYPFEEYAWWRSVMDFAPGPIWERVDVPVLILKGGQDLHSPAEQMRRSITGALERGGNMDFEIVVFPEADHALLEWPLGRGTPPPAFPDGYLDGLLRWVREQVGRGGA